MAGLTPGIFPTDFFFHGNSFSSGKKTKSASRVQALTKKISSNRLTIVL